ncbi:RtcB family protein [Streptacidiphilus sp. EB129]|uniref:RtcB family protein n=1 Tax=Streptacidiphilus sp. EB129 TaxID=3156262 RepID=UPI003513A008
MAPPVAPPVPVHPAHQDVDSEGPGTLRIYSDPHLLSAFTASELFPLLGSVASLPSVTGPVEVFPDVTRKRFGFPSGTVVNCGGSDPFVFPTAVPDVACGFNVVATGLDVSGWTQQRKAALLGRIAAAIGVDSPDRERLPQVDLDAVLRGGVAAVADRSGYAWDPTATEQHVDWEPLPGVLSEECLERAAALAGSVTGHFVAFYTVGEVLDDPSSVRPALFPGELLVVVHTGAPMIREFMYWRHYLPIAQKCLDQGYVPVDLVEDYGLYGVPATDPVAREFLRVVSCAVMYGYANRHIVADRILRVLDRHAGKAPRPTHPRLVRHVGHGAFEAGADGGIRSRRGVQPSVGADAGATPTTTFITGGEYTHAYLMAQGPRAGDAGGRIGHGTPMWQPGSVPTHVLELERATDLGAVLTAGRQAAGNTPFDAAEFWRDAINLEAVASSLESTGLARRQVRLLPFANYKERDH